MKSILVKDYMNPQPLVLSTRDNVRDVVARLIDAKVTGAPVLDDAGALAGFVSEQDCIQEMLNEAFFCEEAVNVSKVMQTNVLTLTPDTSVVEVAQTMMGNKPKNYPVIQHGKLVGLINRRDILRALLENDDDCHLKIPA